MSFASLSAYFSAHLWETLGAITGVLSIYLNTRQSPWGWPIGMISIFCYLYVFWEVFLFGDVLLHLVYLVMAVYGWYQWLYGKTEGGKKLKISKLNRAFLYKLLVLAGAGTLLLGFLFVHYTPSNTLPYADAFTTAFSLVGTYMLARKYIENWLLWIVVNLACIYIYYLKALYITSILYFIYLILAVVGYLSWQKILKSK